MGPARSARYRCDRYPPRRLGACRGEPGEPQEGAAPGVGRGLDQCRPLLRLLSRASGGSRRRRGGVRPEQRLPSPCAMNGPARCHPCCTFSWLPSRGATHICTASQQTLAEDLRPAVPNRTRAHERISERPTDLADEVLRSPARFRLTAGAQMRRPVHEALTHDQRPAPATRPALLTVGVKRPVEIPRLFDFLTLRSWTVPNLT